MTTSEERMKILKMIEEGKISPEEGSRLLGALGRKRKEPQTSEGTGPRWLRVRVTELHSGKESVRVNIPIRLVNVGLRMGARFVPDMEQDLVMEELAEALDQGMLGKIVDVVDEQEGQRVEIFIE